MLDFILNTAAGVESISIPGESSGVGPNFANLTPTGGSQILATSAETWEILSTDANDTLLGTGARTVAVFSLDDDFLEQTTFGALDGTTPVTLGNTHRRSRDMVVGTAGSDPSNTNIGDIIVRVSGGGTERMRIPAGVGDCKSLIFTVPANKTVFPQNLVMFCRKNRDARIRPRITPFGGASIDSGLISTYQNGQSIPITAPVRLEPKTDIIVDCESDNTNTRCLTFFSLLMIDNDKAPTSIQPPPTTRVFMP